MLADLNEPEQLIRELKRTAEEQPHELRWGVVAKGCEQIEAAFEKLHLPKAR